jgi:carboxypeptidase T
MRYARRIFPAIVCLLVLLSPAWKGRASSPPALVRVRIAYQHREELAQLAQAGVDIWEVHSGYVVAVVSHDQEVDLAHQGYELKRLGTISPLSSFDPQYHTAEEMLAELQGLAETHAHLVQLVDIGDSWEKTQNRADRDLWALRIRSDPDGVDPRPNVLFTAAIHARELATAEVALRLARHLLEGYSTDADIAHVLDTRETWIVPMANPDGHIHAELGQSWRKNTNDSEGPCLGSPPPNSYGVDLNRNFSYHWGEAGSSGFPCYLIYRGVGPLSEPEDQALADLIQAQGFVLTVGYHSYGELILYPWGWTRDAPPDLELYQAIARKMASYNGYTWGQASTELYPTSGGLDDWAYHEAGALSFTVEMGTSFDPPYSSVEALWQEHRDPALYLLKIADDPTQAYGPEATDLALVSASLSLTLTALLSDGQSGGQDIAAAEFFVDALGDPGTGWPLASADGAFDSPQEQVAATLPWPGPGRHILYLRGQDGGGHWGPVSAAFWTRHQSFVPIATK